MYPFSRLKILQLPGIAFFLQLGLPATRTQVHANEFPLETRKNLPVFHLAFTKQNFPLHLSVDLNYQQKFVFWGRKSLSVSRFSCDFC